MSIDDVHHMVLDFLTAMQDAATHLDGLHVRYETLTEDPATVVQEVCGHIGVDWEPDMLDYGRHDHGPFVPGIGDFTAEIRSGQIMPEAVHVNPGDIPEAFRPACRTWGYLPA